MIIGKIGLVFLIKVILVLISNNLVRVFSSEVISKTRYAAYFLEYNRFED